MLRFLAFLSVMLTPVWADIVTLKSGRTVEGTFLGGDARQLRLLTSGEKVETFDIGDVSAIQFGMGASTAPVPAAVSSSTAPTVVAATPATVSAPQVAPSTPVYTEAPPAQPASTGVTVERARVEVPAGTSLVVRLIDDVDSKRDSIGKTYRASIDEAVQIAGETVIPRGSDVVLKLADAKKSGTFTGKTELTLDVVTVTVNGKTVDALTDDVTEASSSRTSGTAKKVGGLAAAGAVIGAIAGGGTGAAIGAAAGAGAGAGAQIITRGQTVKIPSEARLNFKLSSPLRI